METIAKIRNSTNVSSVGLQYVYLFPAFLLLVLTGVYLILAPSLHFIPAIEYYDTKRVFQIGLLSGMGFCLIFSKRTLQDSLSAYFALPALIRWLVAIIFVTGVISAALAQLPVYAFLEVSIFILLFCFSCMIAGSYKRVSEAVSYIILGIVVISVFIYCVKFFSGYTLYHLVEGAPLWPKDRAASSSVYFFNQPTVFPVLGFSNVRSFNQIQTWTLPLLALCILIIPKKLNLLRWSMGFLAAFWWMLVIASGARGTAVASIVALLFVAVIYRHFARSWITIQVYACAGGALFFTVLYKLFTSSNTRSLTRSTGDAGRMDLWGNAVEMAANNPILGAGPMHYSLYSNGFSFASAHNAYLQIAAEWGLPTLCVLFFVMFYSLRAWLKQTRMELRKDSENKKSLIRIAVTASLVAGAIDAIVSGIIVSPMSQLYMALIIGWAWGMGIEKKERVELSGAKVNIWMVKIVLALVVCFTAWGISQDVFTLTERQDTYIKEAEKPRLVPRLWQQGYIY